MATTKNSFLILDNYGCSAMSLLSNVENVRILYICEESVRTRTNDLEMSINETILCSLRHLRTGKYSDVPRVSE